MARSSFGPLTLPEGWALDREGRPTVDPAAALDGLVAQYGLYLGSDTPFAACAALTGSWVSAEHQEY